MHNIFLIANHLYIMVVFIVLIFICIHFFSKSKNNCPDSLQKYINTNLVRCIYCKCHYYKVLKFPKMGSYEFD